jgi:hypothetical protein
MIIQTWKFDLKLENEHVEILSVLFKSIVITGNNKDSNILSHTHIQNSKKRRRGEAELLQNKKMQISFYQVKQRTEKDELKLFKIQVLLVIEFIIFLFYFIVFHRDVLE